MIFVISQNIYNQQLTNVFQVSRDVMEYKNRFMELTLKWGKTYHKIIT